MAHLDPKLWFLGCSGQERVIPLPNEAAQSAKASGDVMRLIKEGVTALKVDLNASQAASEDETLLRVSLASLPVVEFVTNVA